VRRRRGGEEVYIVDGIVRSKAKAIFVVLSKKWVKHLTGTFWGVGR
jgi:hypothetical protein